MNHLVNFVASQLLWLASVAGASSGVPLLGPAVFLVFAAYQLSPRRRARGDAALMLLALPLGVLVDSTMSASGLVRYAAPVPVAWLSPVWILTLWMGFALTFNHSLARVMRRPAWAVVFGAIGGPLSYWVAQRAWGAVEFAQPLWPALLVLGALWSAAMWLLAVAFRRLSTPPASRLQPARAAS
ncbi:MAG TPA: DUF2878 domain-containing protein [Pseudoxanthomonas sp.]|nr:DUF2878 domain-containing protein [Pseudoxanthomonas sp.]